MEFTAEQLEQRMKNVERLYNFYCNCYDVAIERGDSNAKRYYQRLIDRCNEEYKHLHGRLKEVKA